jgi:hypothetical protein
VNVASPTSAKALARERVKGLWIAIPTPFTADGRQVDEEALAASVEHYIGGLGVDGIFCGGVMGEFWALSLGERKRVHELVVRQAAGRVPVMAQVGHHAFSDTVELCEHALAPRRPRRPSWCGRGTRRSPPRRPCRCSSSTRCTPATRSSPS